MFKIIESKSKVRQTRAKAVVAKVSTNSSTQAVSSDVAELKDIVRALLLDKKNQASAPAPAPAPVKAVELTAAANYNQVSSNFRPQMVSNHIRPPGFPPVQNSQANNANNFNRGNNFNQNLKRGGGVGWKSNFNQNRGGNFNQSNFNQNQLHRPQVNQSPVYQAPVPQTHGVSKTDFERYVTANDAVLRNMQNQGHEAPANNGSHRRRPPTFLFVQNSSLRNPNPVPILGKAFTSDLTPTACHSNFAETSRALIDVYEGEITLRVGREAITFNLDQTSRYTANYNHMTANRIDVIDMACEEYSQEVLGFTDIIASGNSTPYYDPIVATSSPTLTPFGDSDFLLLEEADSFLGLADDPDCPAYNPFYYDPEGDILILEAILNSEPPLPPPSQGTYLPEVRTELKVCETNTANSSVDEPTEVELKELPPHLEYAFLEGDNKLPVIIAKELDVEEKSALVKVLKSHKRALAWKLSDIQGINPEFCTHKILMEEDYAPAVQHQRRVNPKIHDVIKKEVEKLLEAGLIYPISDSPWVSPIHCVPKKGGMTVVVNEENELIPTRLVTGWRVCIDYRKLNEATRKDHFPLPFMDQMLERLAGNEYYCFLDGFSGYFQIPIDPRDQEKTTFTCPYGTFAYRRMPFGLCNAPGTFQRCMLAIFHDMVEKTMEVFMDDFSVFGNSFQNCLSRPKPAFSRFRPHAFKSVKHQLSLNWEKSHLNGQQSALSLGHKISKKGIELTNAKIDVIAKLPHPTTVKGIRAFYGHVARFFIGGFIQDFSKISRTMTHLLEKNTPFIFSDDCIRAFQTLKDRLTEAPI
ncbi:reverse transcriptase domain-containing protein [Tanacetum coccineum]